MPCYRPLKGYRSRDLNPSGKRSIVFSTHQGFRDMPVELPCGQCIGCRLEKSRQWAIRITHEASLYPTNSFLTLTYSDENLSRDGSLNLDHVQKFLKKLRFAHSEKTIRFYQCGEYGEKFGRPHYHLCIFNHDFEDKVHYKTVNGNKLYTSKSLEALWTYGFCTVGDLTFESAAYVARYVTKKITGALAHEHYNEIDYSTGEILQERKPETATMSRRPGIGKPWLQKFQKDIYPDDFVVLKGKKLKPPKYYNAQYEMAYPSDYERLKTKRREKAKAHQANNTFDRLRVRETIHLIKSKLLKRTYENED